RRAKRSSGDGRVAAAEPVPAPASAAQPAAPPPEPTQHADLSEGPLREHPPPGEPAPEAEPFEAEPPIGVKRVSRLSDEPGRSPRKREPVRKAPRRHRRVRSMRGRIVAVVALVLGAAILWFLYELFQPFHGSGHGRVTVTIPQHSSVSQVADLLERDGVISSSFFFQLRATVDGERSHLRAGTYHLKQDMSYGDVLK